MSSRTPLSPLRQALQRIEIGSTRLSRTLAHGGDGGFFERLSRSMGLVLDWNVGDLARLPQSGPVLLTANRPYGWIEGGALLADLKGQRPDWRILEDRLLELDPDETRQSLGPGELSQRMERAHEHLAAGGALLVMVSPPLGHGRLEQAETQAEALGLARLARESGASVVALALHGGKRRAFLRLLGLDKPGWRREFLRGALPRAAPHLTVQVGSPLSAKDLREHVTENEAAELLAMRRWLLARRGSPKKAQAPRPWPLKPQGQPIASALPPEILEEELSRLPPRACLAISGDLECWVANALQIPNLLREIGRVREETFRAVGEGSGRPLDLDRFDQHYSHLFLWSRSKRCLAGGYRFAPLDQVLSLHGADGLYSHSLLRYAPALLLSLDPALELGRSFVARDWQRSFAPLQLLWRGIGAWVAEHPRYRRLFGLVSMSADYLPLSRELTASFIKQHLYRGDLARLTRPKRPFKPAYTKNQHDERTWRLGVDLDSLSDWVKEIEPDGKGLPVLFRQYAKLGGVFFGFNVDPDFGGALDALVCVDLLGTEPRLLARHMGDEGAARFLGWHGKEAKV